MDDRRWPPPPRATHTSLSNCIHAISFINGAAGHFSFSYLCEAIGRYYLHRQCINRVFTRLHLSTRTSTERIAHSAPLFNFFNDRTREQRRIPPLVKRPLKPKVPAQSESGARERRNAAQILLEMHMMKLISRRRRSRPRNVCKNALSHEAECIASINEL